MIWGTARFSSFVRIGIKAQGRNSTQTRSNQIWYSSKLTKQHLPFDTMFHPCFTSIYIAGTLTMSQVISTPSFVC